MSTIAASLPNISTVLLLLGMTLVLLRPALVWVVGPFFVAWLVFSVFVLTGRRWRSLTFWSLLILPFWLSISTLSMVLLLTSPFVRWVLIIITPFAIGFYLRQVYHYHFSPQNYQPFALENLSGGLGVGVVFLASSSLYGMIVFLGYGWMTLLPLWCIVLVTLSYQMLWVKKALDLRGWRWFAVIVVIGIEIFAVTSFFPTNFFVNGAVVTIMYYTLISLHRVALKEKIERGMILRPLGISFALLLIILGTASWI